MITFTGSFLVKELHLAEGTVRHEKRVGVGTLFWKVGCMTIEKVINNNIVSAFDETGREVVVMGRGIGFGNRPGAKIPEDKIEKIFRIESGSVADQFKELLAGVPLEHAKISSDIISYAKGALKLKLNQSIYVTLTDHINFAIARCAKGINLENALLWEIKRFYPQEYELGKYAITQIKERLKVELPEVYCTSFCECRVWNQYPGCITFPESDERNSGDRDEGAWYQAG